MLSKQKTTEVIAEMGELFPNAHCELIHENPFELLVAVMLSAQCTDKLVNRVTENLFEKYKKPTDYLEVTLEELMDDIRSIGLYRNKAKNIQATAKIIHEQYNDEVPESMKALVSLPGVGQKTANVVMSVAFDYPAIAVDTHVERVSKRLGICRYKDNVKEVEITLQKKIPQELWSVSHHRMIFFGRYFCTARSPKCPECPFLSFCREGKKQAKARGFDG
ncbi:endonuclease III [Brochothrix thermosphacta]|uniref:Endonuclease III n=1 Tax=Brochothrix thermosphacta TaxID=2756 RepID=A0A1D2LVD4_BROTH|nr:endonuclease III [Brochothrix thermosphacta]ATF26774.1 endonuclease III [Brochothrix thermosphacta]ATH86131.1 endonuclease III [Brochothrix thermosphacta]MPQ29320.1 endonuclease III [Brochothrix thermosphacta]ODJ53833.1 endonuclease III [Brochothrix thermosphacta]ODJ55619.1 endonuclease III [Brochothrix thermosphacta]